MSAPWALLRCVCEVHGRISLKPTRACHAAITRNTSPWTSCSIFNCHLRSYCGSSGADTPDWTHADTAGQAMHPGHLPRLPANACKPSFTVIIPSVRAGSHCRAVGKLFGDLTIWPTPATRLTRSTVAGRAMDASHRWRRTRPRPCPGSRAELGWMPLLRACRCCWCVG